MQTDRPGTRYETRSRERVDHPHAVDDLTRLQVLGQELDALGRRGAAEDERVPERDRCLRLQVDGFDSMAGTEAMLLDLAEAAGVPDARARVDAYAREWRERAAAVRGGGRRVLVISACSAQPYSFGRGHVVGDAFAHAGFEVVETSERIRHLRPGEEIPGIVAAVERFKPEMVVSLTPDNAESCSAELGLVSVPVIGLEGRHFFNPGPALLTGLAQLAEQTEQ